LRICSDYSGSFFVLNIFQWLPMQLPIQPSLQVLVAENANVMGFAKISATELQLQKLLVANNVFAPYSSPQGETQLSQWDRVLNAAPDLSVIVASNCSLKFDLATFLPSVAASPRPVFQELDLSDVSGAYSLSLDAMKCVPYLTAQLCCSLSVHGPESSDWQSPCQPFRSQQGFEALPSGHHSSSLSSGQPKPLRNASSGQ
jgi:hypothetical protein